MYSATSVYGPIIALLIGRKHCASFEDELDLVAGYMRTYRLNEEMETSECDATAGTGKVGALKHITTKGVCIW